MSLFAVYLKFFFLFPVLDVVMIGDDVRDDVNGGINCGFMVCNDYGSTGCRVFKRGLQN